ncbi:hypothetical protein [Archangium sp.]|uniref:hypothetical protein n=1 Tax=Archangium sp. TaxID=1872627 RepID=UPI002D4D0321|nr:hypothetical protein [Archangium sp.]HYO55737.1 hypothetical protein [Archangium sp.]
MRIKPFGALTQTYLQVLLSGVGPPQEGIEQAFLDRIFFPDCGPLEPHTFLGLGGSLLASGVEDGAATEVSHVLPELNERLSQVLLKRHPSDELPCIQSQQVDGNLEEDRL